MREGIDPVEQRQKAKRALKAAAAKRLTFREAAKLCHAKHAEEFKNAKHIAQWIKSLETYAFPTLGNLPVAEIDTPEVLAALKPIWNKKPDTADRVRQRISAVFDWAIASKVRKTNNPALWAGCLKPLLASPGKVKKKKQEGNRHYAALPVAEVPRLITDLAAREAISAKALIFAILTAGRSGEIRGAKWDEFDFEERVWRLTAERMKADKVHTVPLSDAAIAILDSLPKDHPSGFVFPSVRGLELSDMAVSKMLKDAHMADKRKGGQGYWDPVQNSVATPHGTARSSFKEWSRQNGRYPDEWSELALAHVNSDQTRAAYARGELLEERRGMMQEWGEYCFRRSIVG